jgi:hypothetical protein
MLSGTGRAILSDRQMLNSDCRNRDPKPASKDTFYNSFYQQSGSLSSQGLRVNTSVPGLLPESGPSRPQSAFSTPRNMGSTMSYQVGGNAIKSPTYYQNHSMFPQSVPCSTSQQASPHNGSSRPSSAGLNIIGSSSSSRLSSHLDQPNTPSYSQAQAQAAQMLLFSGSVSGVIVNVWTTDFIDLFCCLQYDFAEKNRFEDFGMVSLDQGDDDCKGSDCRPPFGMSLRCEAFGGKGNTFVSAPPCHLCVWLCLTYLLVYGL